MLEQLDALWAAVRKLQAQIAPLVQDKEPPPVVPTKDPDEAQRDYEAAQAEVQNQKDRAAQMLKWAEENAAKAKAILDKSKPPEQPATARAEPASRR